MITVVLVDDHVMLRESLRELLDRAADFQVIGEAGDGITALDLIMKLKPQVVLTDISMPAMGGIELVAQVKALAPSVRCLALSSHLSREVINNMLDAGALGYINKAAGRAELFAAIRAVADGHKYMCQQCMALLISNNKSKGADEVLGKREVEILKLVSSGLSSGEIATRLFIAQGTVEVHRRNIMRKLGVHNVVGMTQCAIRLGLITV